MADVKLGNLTFEGVDSVKLDTTYGGEVVFTIDSQARAIENALLSHTLSGEYKNDAAFKDLRTHTFEGNSDLESVDLPNVTGFVDEYCFAYCTSLKNVNLPKVTTLWDGVFFVCDSLRVLDFPKVNRLATASLFKCPLLKAVVLRTREEPTILVSDELEPERAFGYTPIHDGTGYFYVPREMIPAWQTTCADAELTIGNQFRALEDYTMDGTITGELDLTKMGL